MTESIWGSREDLRQQLIEAFADRPEVHGIYVFGREAEGKADQFSDIDMIVCSNDLRTTEANCLGMLSGISPVVGQLLLRSVEYQLVRMFMFQDYSPYQKIDLSLVGDITQEGVFGPFVPVFECPGASPGSTTSLDVIPRTKDATHQLEDVLFAVPRFTKCLHRRDYDMYRRWRGLNRMLWVLLYERHFGWEAETTRRELNPPEAKSVYSCLEAWELEWLEDICPLDGVLNIPRSYRRGVELYVELSYQKAEQLGVPLNAELTKHVLAFLREETRLFE